MDDVIDRRTQLIYASLADHELVRQLEEARRAAAQRKRPRQPLTASMTQGRHRALGTRPWVAAPAAQDDDLVGADVAASGEPAHVIDLTGAAGHPTTVDVTAPAVQVLVGRQQSSEWAADDPSYYLG